MSPLVVKFSTWYIFYEPCANRIQLFWWPTSVETLTDVRFISLFFQYCSGSGTRPVCTCHGTEHQVFLSLCNPIKGMGAAHRVVVFSVDWAGLPVTPLTCPLDSGQRLQMKIKCLPIHGFQLPFKSVLSWCLSARDHLKELPVIREELPQKMARGSSLWNLFHVSARKAVWRETSRRVNRGTGDHSLCGVDFRCFYRSSSDCA